MRHVFTMLCCLYAIPAYAITDEATGLSVDPPAPFVADVESATDGSSTIHISSNTGVPADQGGDHIACSLAFRPVPSNASLSQEQINAAAAQPSFIQQTTAQFATQFDLGEPSVFAVMGVTGIEFDGTPKPGTMDLPVHVYYASMQTPKGLTLMSCFTGENFFGAGLPQMRAIRNTIVAP